MIAVEEYGYENIVMKLFPDSVLDHSIELYSARISKKSRSIYWIIIIGIFLFLILLPFIYVDISIQARGLFQSDIEKQIINTPVYGRVLYSGINEGRQLALGDTIFIIDSETLMAQLNFLKAVFTENESSIHDLLLLAKISSMDPFNGQLNTSRYRSEHVNFNRKFELQDQKYQKTKAVYARNSSLFEHSVISAAEYETFQNNYSLEKIGTEQLIAYHLTLWQNDLAQRLDEKKRLTAEIKLKQEELNHRIIKSPVNGTIIQSSDIQQGSIVTPGQKLAEISPYGNLLAVFYVNPSDIGFVRIGQKVKLQVDAFNYHQWGMLELEINEISNDLISDGSSAFFRVRCRSQGTLLSTRNGAISEVSKGMTFTARVMITRRSLFNLLFDKADKWVNPYQKSITHADQN
jgi:membrane fusion protein, peptide pheromone/bacteriocin exporter